MKLVIRKLAALWVLFISLFLTHNTKAASSKDITTRVNTIRKTVGEKMKQPNQVELTPEEFHQKKDLSDWVNWGNWGNWNNWNNWKNWNNWGNWGNWRNY